MLAFLAMPVVLVLTTLAAAQTISFPTEDGGRVCADLYGQGTHGVVLAHGGRFNKESWREQAQILDAKGFRVLAIDFRGFGCSSGPGQANFDSAPFENDVIAAVHYLKAHGTKSVSACNTKELLNRRNSSFSMALRTLSFCFKRTRILGS